MFKLRYLDSFGSPSAVSIPMVADVNYEAGLPLTALGAVATGTTKPEYICLEKATGVADEKIAAYRILPQHTFETKLTAAGTSLKVGNKVTLAAGGAGVTATTTDGVAEIIRIDGTAIGDTVLVKF